MIVQFTCSPLLSTGDNTIIETEGKKVRSISYRMEMEDFDEGYLIYNAETTWSTMPTDDNLRRASIRVINEPLDGGVVADIADHVKLSDAGEISPDFAANYVSILRGEIPDWVLAVIQISRLGVLMAFFNRETGKEENLNIEWPSYLAVRFEVAREDGGTDAYVLHVAAAEHGLDYLSVTEYDDRGQRSRELRFTPAILAEAKELGDGWSYVYVTEYR